MTITAWAPKGSKKYDWLMQQANDYLDALQKSNTSEWFPDLFRRYFAMFPVALPDPNTSAVLDDERLSDDASSHDDTTAEAQEDPQLLAEMHDKQKRVC